MSRPPASRSLRPWLALVALLPAACAFPGRPAPIPTGATEAEAVEQARREERLKIMQRFWYDQTLSPDRASGTVPTPELLEYPAGDYAGMNFAPRLAADPSLAEPDR
jgi:hypothetical protein